MKQVQKLLSGLADQDINKRNIRAVSIVASIAVLIMVVVFLPKPAYAFAFHLNPLDYIADFFSAFFLSIANALYGLGYMLINMAMLGSRALINDTLTAAAPGVAGGVDINTLNGFVNTIAYSIFGIALLLTIFVTTLGLNLKEWALSTMIPRLAMMIFLMIFSRPIAAVIYDLSSVIVNTINNGASGLEMSNAAWEHVLSGGGSNVITAFLAMIVGLLALVIMIIGFFILIFRAAMILLLMVIAPLAFAMNVLPWTKSMYTKWWSEFIKWTFYLPIFILIMKIGQIVTNMSAFPAGTSGIKAIAVPAGISSDLVGGDWGTVFKTFLDPAGYVMVLSGLVITAAALFVPLTFLGGMASSLGKGAQKAVTGRLTDSAKQAGGVAMSAINKGTPFTERLHDRLGLGKLASSENPAARIVGVAGGSLLGVSPDASMERELGDDKKVRDGMDFTEAGYARMRDLMSDKNPGGAKTYQGALAEMEKEIRSGNAIDDYYNNIRNDAFKDSEVGTNDALTSRSQRNTRLHLAMGGGPRSTDAFNRVYGKDQKVIRAKSAAQLLDKDGTFSATDFLGKDRGIEGLDAEKLGLVKWDKVDESKFTGGNLDKLADMIEQNKAYLERAGSVSADGRKKLEKILEAAGRAPLSSSGAAAAAPTPPPSTPTPPPAGTGTGPGTTT